jgi:two-component system, NarL family, response regulator NreC
MIRVVIADDHALLRQGLVSMLAEEKDIQVIGEAADGFEALKLTHQLTPDVLLIDLVMPNLNGLAVTSRLRSENAPTRVIVLSMRKGEPYIQEALRCGADGYVLKSDDPSFLLTAIRTVITGVHYLSPKVAHFAIDAYLSQSKQAPEDPYETLTTREKEVLQLSAEGMTTEQIAGFLTLSVHTVSTHRRNLMGKLNIKNQGELIKFALARGITTTDL